tara:strand:- start:201 stop:857 length:657 start_codon:yes stop_codon:yes gene_type:complete
MNMTKKCYKCKKDLPFELFNLNKGRKDGYQSCCRDCQRETAKKYYKKNRKKCIDVIRINKRQRSLKNYIKIVTEHLNVPCSVCKKVYHPTAMVFDHVLVNEKLRIKKTEGVNVLIREGYGWAKIREEISKCDVKCHNCHFLKTSKEFKYWKEISSLVDDYSSLIQKLYEKQRNIYPPDPIALEKSKKEISKKFSEYMNERVDDLTRKKREENNEAKKR